MTRHQLNRIVKRREVLDSSKDKMSWSAGMKAMQIAYFRIEEPLYRVSLTWLVEVDHFEHSQDNFRMAKTIHAWCSMHQSMHVQGHCERSGNVWWDEACGDRSCRRCSRIDTWLWFPWIYVRVLKLRWLRTSCCFGAISIRSSWWRQKFRSAQMTE